LPIVVNDGDYRKGRVSHLRSGLDYLLKLGLQWESHNAGAIDRLLPTRLLVCALAPHSCHHGTFISMIFTLLSEGHWLGNASGRKLR
jgi:hypothetical protein